MDEIHIETVNRATQTKVIYSNDNWQALHLAKLLRKSQRQSKQFKNHLLSEMKKSKIHRDTIAKVYNIAQSALGCSEKSHNDITSELSTNQSSSFEIPTTENDESSSLADTHESLASTHASICSDLKSAQNLNHELELKLIEVLSHVRISHKEITKVDHQYSKFFGPMQDSFSISESENEIELPEFSPRNSSHQTKNSLAQNSTSINNNIVLASTPKKSCKVLCNDLTKCSIKVSKRPPTMQNRFLKARRMRFLGVPLDQFLKQEVKVSDSADSDENIEIPIPTQEIPVLTKVNLPSTASIEEVARLKGKFNNFIKSPEDVDISAFNVSDPFPIEDPNIKQKANFSTDDEEWKKFCESKSD